MYKYYSNSTGSWITTASTICFITCCKNIVIQFRITLSEYLHLIILSSALVLIPRTNSLSFIHSFILTQFQDSLLISVIKYFSTIKTI